MGGDFTRDTFDPGKHYSRVLMQQGRVQLDADWNEQASILLHYMRALGRDLFGPHAGPAEGAGFELIGSMTRDWEATLNAMLKEGQFDETRYKALGNAVVRNRIRRRLREIVLCHRLEIPAGWDIVIHPKSSVAKTPFAALTADLLWLLQVPPKATL